MKRYVKTSTSDDIFEDLRDVLTNRVLEDLRNMSSPSLDDVIAEYKDYFDRVLDDVKRQVKEKV